MDNMLGTVEAFFAEDGWPVTPIEGQTALRTEFQGDSGRWLCVAHVLPEQSLFIFYSLSPMGVSCELRMAAAEYLTRANYGLTVGGFEFDFGDGEVRFKTSIDVEGDRLSTGLVRQLVYANVATMDRYLPGLFAVVFGGRTPEAAIAEIEGEPNS
jgi:hypothetical protein